jgi:hypothetical protein
VSSARAAVALAGVWQYASAASLFWDVGMQIDERDPSKYVIELAQGPPFARGFLRRAKREDIGGRIFDHPVRPLMSCSFVLFSDAVHAGGLTLPVLEWYSGAEARIAELQAHVARVFSLLEGNALAAAGRAPAPSTSPLEASRALALALAPERDAAGRGDGDSFRVGGSPARMGPSGGSSSRAWRHPAPATSASRAATAMATDSAATRLGDGTLRTHRSTSKCTRTASFSAAPLSDKAAHEAELAVAFETELAK